MGGWEYNLWNDVTAANVVFRSKVEFWQIPSTIYKRMAVSYAELVGKSDTGASGQVPGGTTCRVEQSVSPRGHIEHRLPLEIPRQ